MTIVILLMTEIGAMMNSYLHEVEASDINIFVEDGIRSMFSVVQSNYFLKEGFPRASFH